MADNNILNNIDRTQTWVDVETVAKLKNVTNSYNIIQSVVNGLGTAIGFTIAIVIMAVIREKIEFNDIPKPFRGSAIVLVTAGLMAMAFFGFSGVI